MKSFRSYSFAVLICVLLAQLSVAQHMTVHFTAHGHGIHASHDHKEQTPEQEQEEARGLCDVCVLAKSFALGLTSNTLALVLNGTDDERPVFYLSSNTHQHLDADYHARAPPSLLI